MGEMQDELERRALEIGLMRRVGQVDTAEMLQVLREVLEHGDIAKAPVSRLLEEHLLTEAEHEQLLGPITVKPTPPGLSRMMRSTEPPKLPPTDPRAAKRWGS